MKKKLFITTALFIFTSFSGQLFAQDQKVANGQHIKDAKLTCRLTSTDGGCSLVFENSASSSAKASSASKKGYDAYMAQSSFSVSAADNSVSEIVSPRDAASGLPTGKRMHKPVSSSSSDASSATASGGGSGKVNVHDISFSKVSFKEFTVTKRCAGKTTKISCDGGECDIPTGDCPNGDCAITADWSWGASQGGSSKRCTVDFLLSIEDGVCTKMAINEKGSGNTKGTTKK